MSIQTGVSAPSASRPPPEPPIFVAIQPGLQLFTAGPAVVGPALALLAGEHHQRDLRLRVRRREARLVGLLEVDRAARVHARADVHDAAALQPLAQEPP